MKRITWLLLVIAFLTISPLVARVFAADPFAGTEHIEHMDVSIALQSDGTAKMNERISYDFGDLTRHGIYRDIGFIKTNDTGKRYVMDFSDVTITDGNGSPYRFESNTQGDNLQWKIGDPDKTITGKHLYDLSYTASGILTYFPSHDELYWNAVGTGWPVPISDASVTVTLPKDVPEADIHADCFTGKAGERAKGCATERIDPRSVTVRMSKPLSMNEGLTIVVGFPKGVVAVLEPREQIPFFDTFAGKITLVLLAIASVLWYVVAPIAVVRAWLVGGRDPKPAMGEAKAWFSPPKTPHHRLLTPAETGTLVDERADLRDIYASIVDLARRGYLKIIETQKNVFDLEKTKDWKGDVHVLPFERELLDGVFATGERVSIKAIDLTRTLEKVKGMLYESLVTDKFFPSNPNTLRGWYIALAVVSFLFVNPILFLVSLMFGQHMPRKTLFGAEAAAMARALRHFLTSQEKQLSFQAKNQMMFEKLLPFAVAFGVEEIWAARFKSLGMKNPDWYESTSGGRFNSVVFAHSLGHGMSSSFAASIAAHSSTGHSSGFSGGSSGGGGGGGGGGSW